MKMLFERSDRVHAPLYVVTTVFNPIRFRSRWKLYEDFAKRVDEAGAILYTAEVAFGDRDFVVTRADEPRHVQLRTHHELWHKENATNLAIARLPAAARYVAWVDSDVRFARDDWADETVQQLQHHKIVQMWSEAHDLDSNHHVLQTSKSFSYCYAHQVSGGGKEHYAGGRKTIYRHPGFAWAARREALDSLGGLIDFCMVGSADYHMAYALTGEIEATLQRPFHPRYKWLLRQWQTRAESAIRRNIGYVPGLLLHYWHGTKASRQYMDRWKILHETGFNPDVDLNRDVQGLWQLTERSIELRDRLRAYFRQRDEDATFADAAWLGSMNPS